MPLNKVAFLRAPIHIDNKLPDNYSGVVLEGATARTYYSRDGWFAQQEWKHDGFCLRYQVGDVSANNGVKMERVDNGVQATAVLCGKCRETIAGVGRVRMQRGMFSAVYAQEWDCTLEWNAQLRLGLLDTVWQQKLLEKYLPEDSEWWRLLQAGDKRIPRPLAMPYRIITPSLKELMRQVMYNIYVPELQEIAMDHLVKEYLLALLAETKNEQWISGIISASDLEKIDHAKSIIAKNLYAHHHTVAVAAAVGLNECKLKALFRRVTGMGTFDYLMYLRCSAVKEEIMSTDYPLKAFVKKAGYRDLANFITGFRRHMGISPAALRRK